MVFNLGADMYDAIFEEYVGTALVNRQTAQMPAMFVVQNFMNFVQQVANINQPHRIKVLRYEDIWDKFEQRVKQVEYSVDFQNWED